MNIDPTTVMNTFISIFLLLRYPVCSPVFTLPIPDPLPDTGLVTGYGPCWASFTGEGEKRETPFLYTGALPAPVEIA